MRCKEYHAPEILQIVVKGMNLFPSNLQVNMQEVRLILKLVVNNASFKKMYEWGLIQGVPRPGLREVRASKKC